MGRIAVNKASGTDFVPDLEDWWGDFDENVPPPKLVRPKLRVIENPNLAPSNAARKKAASRARKRRAELALNRALMMMTALVLVVGLFLQISRLAEISSQSKKIAELNAELNNLDAEYQNLQVRLSMQENIDRVRNEAVNRLKMVYPEGDALKIVQMPGDMENTTPAKTADNSGMEENNW